MDDTLLPHIAKMVIDMACRFPPKKITKFPIGWWTTILNRQLTNSFFDALSHRFPCLSWHS